MRTKKLTMFEKQFQEVAKTPQRQSCDSLICQSKSRKFVGWEIDEILTKMWNDVSQAT